MTIDTKQINFQHKVGMAVGGALALWAARLIGYSDPVRQIPEVSALIMAFNMAVPMAAWMRYRGMEWGPISEMSGAMFVEVILLIGIVWLGLCPESSLILWQHVLMIPAMIVPMLYRRDLYTGHVGHHVHTVHTV